MTILFQLGFCVSPGNAESRPQTTLSSRPEESWACGPPKLINNAFGPAITFHGTVALSFVIPSEAGFPASLLSPATTYVVLLKENHMQLTEAAPSTGNPGKPRDLQFRGPFVDMFFTLDIGQLSYIQTCLQPDDSLLFL
jgi:hypothetical protein